MRLNGDVISIESGKEIAMEGNVQKMLDALRSIQSVAKAMNGYVAHSEFDDKNIKQYASLIKDYVRYALSEPPRNCDVGTAEEQSRRFDNYCRGRYCDTCPCNAMSRCSMVWAQTPYEAQEGGAI